MKIFFFSILYKKYLVVQCDALLMMFATLQIRHVYDVFSSLAHDLFYKK